MADDTPDLTQPADWTQIGNMLADGLVQKLAASGVNKAVVASLSEAAGSARALAWKGVVDIAAVLGDLLHKLEEPGGQLLGPIVAPSLAGLFGAGVDASTFTRRLASGEGEGAARAIVEGLMKAITGGGTGGTVEPSTDGVSRLATASVQAGLESTWNAALFECLSDILPEVGHFTALTDIPEEIIRILGLSRLLRRALAPAVDATCTTPAKWFYAKAYRQHLLGPGVVGKQLARARWTPDQAKEELAREGYSDDRIEALLNDSAKFIGLSEISHLVRANLWTEDDATTHLQDQGYDPALIVSMLKLAQIADIESFERAAADAAVAAFAAGRIDEGTLGGFCTGVTITEQHKAQLVELAHTKRICQQKPITSVEAKAAVLVGVLAIPDYRAALEQENRSPDAVDVLELMLRAELDTKKTAADHKAAADQAKAAAAAQKLADAQAKKTAADQKAAILQLGPPAQLEDAYVRGLIPIDRVEEIYTARYDPDAVGVLVARLEDKRQQYVDQQAKAAAAAKRASSHGVSVAQLEAALLTGVIDIGRFRQMLTDQGISDADAQLLTDTAAVKLKAKQDADTAHAAAVAAAKVKHVDLPTLELLVRRGHRSLDDFAATLASLGYDDVARAALVERLQIQMSDDAAAAQVKAAAAAKLAAKGLSLTDFHRAVVLGIKTTTDYATFLLQNGQTADTVATLVQIAQTDADEAAAARTRRAAADAKAQTPAIPLTDLARAVKLGLVSVDVYTARLQASGYTADDISVEQDLLVQEIADVKAAQAKRDAAGRGAGASGLTLAQTATAVKLGELTIDDYTARAKILGMSDDDAATVTRVLQDEIDATAALQKRKAELVSEDATRELARADVEKAVTDNLQTIDDYAAWLRQKGYAADDTALLVSELQQKLDAAAAKAAP